MRMSSPARPRTAALALMTVLAVVAGQSCSSSEETRPATELVGFVSSAAEQANGAIPRGDVVKICGSDRYGWLSEIQHTSFANARVRNRWGAFIPSAAGHGARQMMASGTITAAGLGGTDVPFDHPFGGDLSLDVALDRPYIGLGQNLGAAAESGGNRPDTVHAELMAGLVPHVAGSVIVSPGQDWPTFAEAMTGGLLPGFQPRRDDRIALMGSWVVDCGHPDFHSELHSISFLAFAHREGGGTIARAFYNPYEVTQLYNPDASLSHQVNDAGRFADPRTQDSLGYFASEILRLAGLAQPVEEQVRLPHLLTAFHESPAPWQVCAPSDVTGTGLAASYAFSARPGVTVQVSALDSKGCVTVTTTLTDAYQALDPAGQQECPTQWSWLTSAALREGEGGIGAGLDLPTEIVNLLSRTPLAGVAASIKVKLQRPVVSDCYPPISAATIPAPGPGLQTVTTSASQAFPLVGWVRVGRP
jgi:hypothetical protein